MTKTKRQKVEEWLTSHNDILTILPLERKLGFPRGTLSKFLIGKRKLSFTEIKTIDTYIQDMISKYLESD